MQILIILGGFATQRTSWIDDASYENFIPQTPTDFPNGNSIEQIFCEMVPIVIF